MMNFCFFLGAAVCLIVFQTAVLPSFAWFSHSFDLLLIVVLYISLAFSHTGAVLAVAALGLVMDSLSGGPFFLHVFSYLWVYIIVQLLKQVVFQRSVVFMMVVSLSSVLIQKGLILFSIFLDHGQQGVLAADFTRMLWQVVLGCLVIPPSIWLMTVLRQNTFYMIRRFRREMSMRYRD